MEFEKHRMKFELSSVDLVMRLTGPKAGVVDSIYILLECSLDLELECDLEFESGSDCSSHIWNPVGATHTESAIRELNLVSVIHNSVFVGSQ